ncbi:MAG: glutamate racemase [Cytophagales bacterium]|nr:glutamate racemase [Cytophagales bacterium]
MTIGIFDSGIGGLSILQALRALMPAQDYIYLADSAYAPYGERDAEYVLTRSRTCVQALLDEGCGMIVIACNTATALAGRALRNEYPVLPIVGIEPAIKPAAALTRNGHVGVLATQGTLASSKFLTLLDAVKAAKPQVHIHPFAPHGLALAIETQDAAQIERLSSAACQAMLGTPSGMGCDTVVLGCTHYPLIRAVLASKLGTGVQLIDPADAVAQQARQLLPDALKLRAGSGTLMLRSTGDLASLSAAIARYAA